MLTSLDDGAHYIIKIISRSRRYTTFISFNQASVTLGVFQFQISSSLLVSNCCCFGCCQILIWVTSIYRIPLSFWNAFASRMSTSAYLCYGVNFVCWCPPCFYLFFFLSFFSFVEYILHKYGISAISFACWTFCIFQSHIMISGTSWKKFQNSLVEWQKETQTDWNKTWALSAIRRETIDTPVYFCTVCRWKCIRAHQSVMKFMNANRSTNEFMCQCMFTIQ